MNSRPLLDYLAYPEDLPEPPVAIAPDRPIDPLEARLKDFEMRLRERAPEAAPQKQDLTLSAQIEAILRRRAAPQSAAVGHADRVTEIAERPARPERVVVEPPPTAPASNDNPPIDPDFLKFSEAVYLIGQAAKRFIEQPQPAPQQITHPAAPSSGEIEALSAVLRETVSAFRSVADDLAVSAGEFRNLAAREERQPAPRRPEPARHRDDDEILELRDGIADLQDRLDDLLQSRRRARY